MSDTSADTPATLDTPDRAAADVAAPTAPTAPLDLAEIERDLVAVEAALPRLDDGSYWVDEVTGEAIPDDVLADNPGARRA